MREKTASLVTRCFAIEMDSRDRHRRPTISKVEYPDEAGTIATGSRPGEFL